MKAIPRIQTNKTYIFTSVGLRYQVNISKKDIKIGDELKLCVYPWIKDSIENLDLDIVDLSGTLFLLIDYKPDKKENVLMYRQGVMVDVFNTYLISTSVIELLQGNRQSLSDIECFTQDLSIFGGLENYYIARDMGSTTYIEGQLPSDLYFEVNTPDKLERAFSYVCVSNSGTFQRLNIRLNCDISTISEDCFLRIATQGELRSMRVTSVNLTIPNILKDSNTVTKLLNYGRFKIEMGYEEFLTHIRQWSYTHRKQRSMLDITALTVVFPPTELIFIHTDLAEVSYIKLKQLREQLTNHSNQQTYIEALDWYLARYKPQ